MMETQASVLVVDDNTNNLQILADILRNRDYKVAMVKDGQKALTFAEKRKPDIILLDIMMPEMDGFEVSARLKAGAATRDIPIIFISALTQVEDKVKGFSVGGVDYITKPFQKEEVLARVKTHIELKRSRETLQDVCIRLQKANEELGIAARTDSLTRLSNRRDITEKIDSEISRHNRNQKPFTLILADIDDFKQFNDRHGHDCGDFILITVAERMRERLRKQDVIARWGGEEFLILLPETDVISGEKVGKILRKDINENLYLYKDNEFRIRMTFGVSAFINGDTRDQCIRKADEALYQGKNAGKNCVVVYGSP